MSFTPMFLRCVPEQPDVFNPPGLSLLAAIGSPPVLRSRSWWCPPFVAHGLPSRTSAIVRSSRTLSDPVRDHPLANVCGRLAQTVAPPHQQRPRRAAIVDPSRPSYIPRHRIDAPNVACNKTTMQSIAGACGRITRSSFRYTSSCLPESVVEEGGVASSGEISKSACTRFCAS
jgi:hypothetical protein